MASRAKKMLDLARKSNEMNKIMSFPKNETGDFKLIEAMDTSAPTCSAAPSTLEIFEELDVLEPFQDSGSEYAPDDDYSDSTISTPAHSILTPTQRSTFDLNYLYDTPENLKIKSGKKRPLNTKFWKRNQAKHLKNLGKPFTSSKGVSREEKYMLKGCGDTCRMNCESKISETTRYDLFKSFYKLGCRTRQWDFLSRLVENNDKKRTIVGVTSKRTCTRKYNLVFFQDNIELKVQVCQKMFLNTFSISAQTIRTVFEKIAHNDGISLSPDKRGQHIRPVNELKEHSKMLVKEHIESFPLVESHYCRKDSNKKYLNNEIKSVGQMFRLYEEWFESRHYDSIYKVTLRQYRDIFNFSFNLSFYVPKKDQCDFCLKYENMSPEQKIASKVENDQHLFSKQKARELKEADKISAQSSFDTVTACFDFQKILSTPTGNTSCFYYKRKLQVYNFTVYELASHEANCYVWDETIAKKGCLEVSNCLLKFIEEYLSRGVLNFHFWSDNCGGQNKNKVLFGFFAWASKNFKINITHRFLEKGHTQNEGDSVHALIEKSQKNKIVYTPIQWYSIIRNAKTKKPGYKVIEMIQDDFKDFKTFSNSLNWIKNLENEKLTISKIREVCFSSDKYYEMKYKYFFDDDFKIIALNAKKTNKNKNRTKKLPKEVFERVYKGPIPVSTEKYLDLIWLCQQNLIPLIYQEFYMTLKTTSSIPAPSDTENDD